MLLESRWLMINELGKRTSADKGLVVKDREFIFKKDRLLSLLGCDEEAKPFRRAIALLEQARPYLRPAFAIRSLRQGVLTKEGIAIEGIELQSCIVADKLAAVEPVYAYIATCSLGIEQLIARTAKASDKYFLDQLAYLAYLQAMDEVELAAAEFFGVTEQVRLCPGSVIGWQVIETKKIFALLGDLVGQLQVSINDQGLMAPLKTTVGVFYASQEDFSSCSLCPRRSCTTRNSSFDDKLYQQMTDEAKPD